MQTVQCTQCWATPNTLVQGRFRDSTKMGGKNIIMMPDCTGGIQYKGGAVLYKQRRKADTQQDGALLCGEKTPRRESQKRFYNFFLITKIDDWC